MASKAKKRYCDRGHDLKPRQRVCYICREYDEHHERQLKKYLYEQRTKNVGAMEKEAWRKANGPPPKIMVMTETSTGKKYYFSAKPSRRR